MNDYNTNFEYKQVNSKLILSDPDYQRNIDFRRVKRIVSAFDEKLVSPVKVSFRENKYYVFDGQHTLAALKMRNGNKDLQVNCKVYYGLTKQKEAELFSQQNGISKNVETIDKLKALYIAGDADVIKLVQLTKLAGLYIDFNKGQSANRIVAVSKAFSVLKGAGEKDYVEILSLIKSTWGGAPESLTAQILGGVYMFHKAYKGIYDKRTFIQKLYQVTPAAIVRDGRLLPINGDSKYAQPILQAYNRKLTTRRLDNNALMLRL